MTEFLVPIIPKCKNIMSYEDWYDIYCEDVEEIIDYYIEKIMNDFKSNEYYHTLDILKFKCLMRNIIYNKSISRFKHQPQYLP